MSRTENDHDNNHPEHSCQMLYQNHLHNFLHIHSIIPTCTFTDVFSFTYSSSGVFCSRNNTYRWNVPRIVISPCKFNMICWISFNFTFYLHWMHIQSANWHLLGAGLTTRWDWKKKRNRQTLMMTVKKRSGWGRWMYLAAWKWNVYILFRLLLVYQP